KHTDRQLRKPYRPESGRLLGSRNPRNGCRGGDLHWWAWWTTPAEGWVRAQGQLRCFAAWAYNRIGHFHRLHWSRTKLGRRTAFPHLRPTRLLGLRYPPPGRSGERAPRLSWPSWSRIIPNQFPNRRDSIVESTKFLLGAASFSPQLLQHPTYVGHPHLLSFFQYGKTASHLKPRSNGCLALSTGCAFIRACAVAGRSIKHCATRTPAGRCGTRSACRAGCVRRHGAAEIGRAHV